MTAQPMTAPRTRTVPAAPSAPPLPRADIDPAIRAEGLAWLRDLTRRRETDAVAATSVPQAMTDARAA